MKNIYLLIFSSLIFYTISDLIFSNFIYKEDLNLKYDCFNYKNYNFNNVDYHDYDLLKNCEATEKQRTVEPYQVLTDKDGYRFSGKKKILGKKNIVFLGDSFTYGFGVKFEDSFPGLVEKKLEGYNIYNLGVPSYGIQKYNYSFKKFLEKKNVSKIFLTLDMTDIYDSAFRWNKIENLDTPVIDYKKLIKDISAWKQFKYSNFKGTRYFIFYLRNSARYLKIKILNYLNWLDNSEVSSSQYAYFTYKKLNEDSKLNQNNFSKSIKIIEQNIIEISSLAKKNNADLYLIILPWPETLVFGQDVFNWEKFADDLCTKSNCNKLLNLFDDFRAIKEKNEKWLDLIYIKDDVHLTKFGNNLIANKVVSEF